MVNVQGVLVKKDDLSQIKRYEEHIQQKIEAYCMCCEKLLFPEQISLLICFVMIAIVFLSYCYFDL